MYNNNNYRSPGMNVTGSGGVEGVGGGKEAGEMVQAFKPLQFLNKESELYAHYRLKDARTLARHL